MTVRIRNPARQASTSVRSAGKIDPEHLLAEADRARRTAYAPYSGFAVGAALLTGSGRVVRGCNVENASLGLTICAERNAVWKAVGEGEREFVAIAVTAGRGNAASPCGACRQVLHEFAPRLWVLWRNERGGLVRRRLETLLACPFRFAMRKKR